MPNRANLRWLIILILLLLLAACGGDDNNDTAGNTPIPTNASVVNDSTGQGAVGARPTLPPSFEVSSDSSVAQTVDGTAGLRIIHAISDLPAIDVLLDDTVIYRTVRPNNATLTIYRTGGEHNLVLSESTSGRVRTGNEAVYYSGNILLEDNITLVFLFTGSKDDVQVQVFEENLSLLEPDFARVGFVNALTDVETLTVKDNIQIVTTPIPFGQQSEFLEFIPRTYVFDFFNGDVFINSSRIELKRGWSYLIVAVGTSANSQLVTIESETPPQTRFRVSHVAPDTIPLQLRLDDQIVAENLQFGEFTDFQLLPSGQYLAEIYLIGADGTVDDVPIQIRNVQLKPFETVELAVFGPDIDLNISAFPIDTTPIQIGESRVMFVHVGYGHGRLVVQDLSGDDLGVSLNYGTARTISFVPSRQNFFFYSSAEETSVEQGRDLILEPATVYTYFIVGRQTTQPIIEPVDVVLQVEDFEPDTISADTTSTTRMWVYNGWRETIAVYFNGERIALGLPPSTVSQPTLFEPVSGMLEIFNANGELLFEKSIFLEPEDLTDNYYLYVVPNGPGIALVFLPDLTVSIGARQAEVKLIHALPSYDQLAVAWNNDQLAQMFFGSLTPPYVIEAGTVTFEVIDRAVPELLFSQEVNIQAGKTYRLIIMEGADGLPTITVLEDE